MAASTTEITPILAVFKDNPYQPRINQLTAALNNPVPLAKNPALQDEMTKTVFLFKRFLQKNIDHLNNIWPLQKEISEVTAKTLKLATELNGAREKNETIEQSKINTVLKFQELLSKLNAENQAINEKIKKIEEGCYKIQEFILLMIQENPSVEQLTEFQRWSSENTLF